MTPKQEFFRWRHAPLWLFLLVYWLISMMGAGMLERARFGSVSGFIVLMMLIAITVCMLTEHGRWQIWQRIGLVFVSWFIQAILTIPVALTVGAYINSIGFHHLVDRSVAFLSTLPLVIFAMYHSKLFVSTQQELEKSERNFKSIGRMDTTPRQVSHDFVTNRVVISCPSCRGRLRVPDNLGELRVTCTHCKHKFTWSPKC